ncbi:outer membrane channel protein TolC [Alteromonas sp. 5E99-2]|uniref:outer membrane channel protein TolC n=1 Tax=Alteromonas sp. 5E99-2 TaxID=2817683 RepID=UPI001A99AAEA|nr:outer membrane channel protein TolC [Alteromonas sp. 5E99-2]MBO1256685.1 outer membrane channel protein TolC [Alteromonas sp. 5E99-2]
MKKTALSLLVGLVFSGASAADNLVDIYEQALANDPVVKQAKANRDSAFKGISVSRADLLPQVSASIGYTFTGGTSSQAAQIEDADGNVVGFNFPVFDSERTNFNYGIDASISIYDHSNWVNLRRAEKVAQQSDSQYAAELQELIVRVVTAYLSVLREQDNLEFVQAEKRAIARQLEQTKQRFEVGLTAITDVHEAQANFDNTVASEIQAENAVELALEDLRVITGKYHKGLDVLNKERFSATRPQPETVKEWLDIAEERNLELLAQNLQIQIAKDDIDATKAGLYPTASLSAFYDEDDSTQTIGDLPEADIPSVDTYGAQATISIPIFAGNRIRSQTKQARYAYVVASEQRELIHRQTIQQVRSSYNDVRAAVLSIKALGQSVVSAESALQATEAGFDVGTRTIVDVLDSTRNLFDASRNLASARYDFIQAVINLKRASGELTKSDLEMINKGLMTPKS